jgi:ABC-type multidrug transport system permease subunit
MFTELLLAELKSFYRNPGILFWTFGFPIMLSLILGLAFSNKQDAVKKISIVGEAAYQMIENKGGESIKGPYSTFTFYRDSEDSAILKMKRGEISLYIKTSLTDELQYFFDPNNTDSFLTYLQLKEGLNTKEDTTKDIVRLETPGTRYIDFLVPGLLAMGVMNTCLWGSAWTLIEFRIKKLLRRLMSTPLKKSTFLLTHIFMRYLLGGVEFTFLALFGILFFDIQIQGSLLAMWLVYTSGIIGFSGISIALSSRASNNQIANGLINAVSMPMMIASGIFFSYHNFPPFLESFVSYFPLTLLADSMRAIVIEGAGISEVWKSTFILNLMGVFFFTLGIRIYKWD